MSQGLGFKGGAQGTELMACWGEGGAVKPPGHIKQQWPQGLERELDQERGLSKRKEKVFKNLC